MRRMLRDHALGLFFLLLFLLAIGGQAIAGYFREVEELAEHGMPAVLDSDRAQLVGAHAPDEAPAWAKAVGWRRTLYGNSLLIVMGAVFAASWLIQSLTGTIVAGEESVMHGLPAPTWAQYVVSADFWDRTLQNWQSEFLAVGAMVAFSIYLRQRGSAESKPVGMPHAVSAVESE